MSAAGPGLPLQQWTRSPDGSWIVELADLHPARQAGDRGAHEQASDIRQSPITDAVHGAS